MRAGGTAQGLIALVREFDASPVGVGVLVTTKTPADKLVRDHMGLFMLNGVDESRKNVDINLIK